MQLCANFHKKIMKRDTHGDVILVILEDSTRDMRDSGPSRWRKYTRWRPTSQKEAASAEDKLLTLCRSGIEVQDVRVGSEKQAFMHTLISGDESNPPLVCIPGYGAGAGFYFRNIDGLAKQFRVHLVDLLGTGMSGRPTWRAKSREQAENFFVDALSSWHKELKLGKVVLMGHSLGGYLAATYALRHPEDVEHLVLVCPAGLVRPPENVTPAWAESFWTWRGQFYRFGKLMWNGGLVTPGSFVRTLGPWGPGIVEGYTNNRFRHGDPLTEEETDAFAKYFYHITAQRGSGEYALSQLLGPMAWARHPLEGRMHQLKVPCSLIYGESDWMKPDAGKRILEDVGKERGKLSDSDLQWDIIAKAGHYCFLDQPDIFLQKLLKQTKAYVAERSPQSRRRFEAGMSEANAKAEAALADDTNQAKRTFDV